MNEEITQPGSNEQGTRKVAEPTLGELVPSPDNPRLGTNRRKLDELKRSIRHNGLIQAITVRPVGDIYEIVGGHRRVESIRQLAEEYPNDPRFKTVAAVILLDVDDRLPQVRLAENLNRADLTPLEVGYGVIRALNSGLSIRDLAKHLGWKSRKVYRYAQLATAPAWFQNMCSAGERPRVKSDATGAESEVEAMPGLDFAHVIELLSFYERLHEADRNRLASHGGEDFKPEAERIVKKLGSEAAAKGWTIAQLREQITRIRDPESKAARRNTDDGALKITPHLATIRFAQVARLTDSERNDFAAKLVRALINAGFKTALLGKFVDD